jgi:hypothetical protein
MVFSSKPTWLERTIFPVSDIQTLKMYVISVMSYKITYYCVRSHFLSFDPIFLRNMDAGLAYPGSYMVQVGFLIWQVKSFCVGGFMALLSFLISLLRI